MMRLMITSTDRPLPARPEMERAFFNSDRTYDGVFFTAVKSTGIFCRPSCPARKPRPENVEFFGSPKAALFAGYRACLRCRPLDNPNSRPDWMVRLLETVHHTRNARISGADLHAMGIDPARARRQFLKDYGLTFQAYCRAHRLCSALDFIRQGGTLDDAVFESGYESHSGFRESFQKTFGVPPGQAGTLDCIQLAWIETPVGPMIAGAAAEGICLLEFTDRRMLERELENLRRRLSKPLVPGENPHLSQLESELKEYFAGARREFTLPLVQNGSAFEKAVWDRLLQIPHGEVRSYEDIARLVGQPKAVRAVGRANGMNCIAILVPCHRVVRKNGDLGGYGGGVERKRFLLDLERTLKSAATN